MPYLILDGYNIIGALERYSKMADADLEAGRESLISDALKMAGWTGAVIIIVFDAHRSAEPERTEVLAGGAVRVTYTAPGQVADDVIERLVENLHDAITVYTADYAQQRAVLAHGATRATPRELERLIMELPAMVRSPGKQWRSTIDKHLSPEVRHSLEEIRRKPGDGKV